MSNQRLAFAAALAVCVLLALVALAGRSQRGVDPVARSAPPASAVPAAPAAPASLKALAVERAEGPFEPLEPATPSALPVPAAPEPRLVGSLAGRALLPEGIDPARVLAFADSEDPARHAAGTAQQVRAPLDAAGTFALADLPPGPYRVGLCSAVDFAWDAICARSGIPVYAGEVAAVPTFDLRAALRAFRVRATDASGAAVPGTQGTYCRPGTGANNDLAFDAAGEALLLTAGADVDLWVGAPGFECVRVPDLAGDATLVLAPAIPVRVRIVNPAAIPPGIEIEVGLGSGLGADNWVLGQISSSERRLLSPEFDAVLLAPGARRYALALAVVRRDAEPPLHAWVALDPPATIDVPAKGAGELTLDVALDAERLRAAVASR